jgi:hypothetical protein
LDVLVIGELISHPPIEIRWLLRWRETGWSTFFILVRAACQWRPSPNEVSTPIISLTAERFHSFLKVGGGFAAEDYAKIRFVLLYSPLTNIGMLLKDIGMTGTRINLLKIT